jgi:rubrerythrin
MANGDSWGLMVKNCETRGLYNRVIKKEKKHETWQR